jgi:hypothetical protein
LKLFLLGAGFNLDAVHEAGRYQSDCGYPVLADVLKLCFGLEELPAEKSVEDLFHDALAAGTYDPLKKLADRLQEADYRIAQSLASSETANSYKNFFEWFKDANFLTFNYDSLAEIFLARRGRWCPEDGYGIPVSTERGFRATPIDCPRSSSLVLHLHGTMCVYTADFEIRDDPFQGVAELVHRERPLYAFDADAVTPCFSGYRRMMLNTGRVDIEERVIAPVPDKSEDLKQAFIRETFARAVSLISEVGNLTAIGYSFNEHDRASYRALLQALSGSRERTLTVVSPEANHSRARIGTEYPNLRIEPVERTFGMWASQAFAMPMHLRSI